MLCCHAGGYVYLWTLSDSAAKALNPTPQLPDESTPTRRGKRSRQAASPAAAAVAATADDELQRRPVRGASKRVTAAGAAAGAADEMQVDEDTAAAAAAAGGAGQQDVEGEESEQAAEPTQPRRTMSVDDAVALVEVRACGGVRLCMPLLNVVA
jgi:hypothetical protein